MGYDLLRFFSMRAAAAAPRAPGEAERQRLRPAGATLPGDPGAAMSERGPRAFRAAGASPLAPASARLAERIDFVFAGTRWRALPQRAALWLARDVQDALGTERALGEQIMREVRRDPDFLDDPVLLEYLTSLWQPLLAAARARGFRRPPRRAHRQPARLRARNHPQPRA